jgi:hypothetical protein
MTDFAPLIAIVILSHKLTASSVIKMNLLSKISYTNLLFAVKSRANDNTIRLCCNSVLSLPPTLSAFA